MNTPDIGLDVSDRRKRQAKRGVFLGFVIAAVVGILALSVMLAGIIATVVYAFLFLMSLTAIPLLISLLGNALPGSAGLGKGHIVLTAFAFDHHYLVDMGDRWEWCPGDADTVYVNGEHIEIDGGTSKRSVFGWRPFGILRYKDANTYSDVRVDQQALNERGATATDGGNTPTSERGGVREVDRPLVSGVDGEWVVDLKRLYDPGLLKLGDVELIETTEEITMRQESEGQSQAWWQPMVYVAVGLLIGIPTGYVFIFA